MNGKDGIIKGFDIHIPTNDIIAPWTGSFVLRPLAIDFDIDSKRIYWSGSYSTKNKEFLVKQPQYGIMAASTNHSELKVIIDTGIVYTLWQPVRAIQNLKSS